MPPESGSGGRANAAIGDSTSINYARKLRGLGTGRGRIARVGFNYEITASADGSTRDNVDGEQKSPVTLAGKHALFGSSWIFAKRNTLLLAYSFVYYY